MDARYFSEKIVEWYLNNKRELPWRNTADPYKIWLSEVILQQTRVVQGLPYYNHFVTRYPTVQALAAAAEQDVLRSWQGLGYYTRARNLHRCAKVVAHELGGKFPTTYDQLIKLPGIGDYTAAAIASIAFQQAVAVVDGNVFRILARIFGKDTVINSPQGKKEFTTLANTLITGKRPDLHNQAMMEFGATYCTPKSPNCGDCIFQKTCFARVHQAQHLLPVKNKIIKEKKRYFNYLVLDNEKSLVMKQRTEKDIWLGLYDFPLIETKKPTDIKKLLPAIQSLLQIKKVSVIDVSDAYKHVLTHQTIFGQFIRIRATREKLNAGSKNFSFREIAQLPKPVLITRYLNDHYNGQLA